LLFSTVNDILSKEDNDMIYKTSTEYIMDQAKRTLEKIIGENDNGEINSNKKIKSYAQEGLLSIEQLQADLEGNDGSGEQSNATDQYTLDAKFIESLNEPGKNKKWKEIFDKGKAKGLFKSYNSSATLKSSYYHIKRRKTQKK
jgi:hypothetical protein